MPACGCRAASQTLHAAAQQTCACVAAGTLRDCMLGTGARARLPQPKLFQRPGTNEPHHARIYRAVLDITAASLHCLQQYGWRHRNMKPVNILPYVAPQQSSGCQQGRGTGKGGEDRVRGSDGANDLLRFALADLDRVAPDTQPQRHHMASYSAPEIIAQRRAAKRGCAEAIRNPVYASDATEIFTIAVLGWEMWHSRRRTCASHSCQLWLHPLCMTVPCALHAQGALHRMLAQSRTLHAPCTAARHVCQHSLLCYES